MTVNIAQPSIADVFAAVQQVAATLNDFMDVTARAFGRVERDIATLKEDVALLKTDVALLKTDVALLKTDVALLKTDVSALKEDVAGLKNETRSLRYEINEIKVHLNDHDQRLAYIQEDITLMGSYALRVRRLEKAVF